MTGRDARYAFGDTDLARERLALVADTFAAPTRALLARSAAGRPPLRASTSAAGPGTRPRCSATRFPHAFVTGLDASAAMVDRGAATRSRARAFVVADVTAPLRLPAHVVYARLLLGHLPDPGARARALGRGAASAPGCSCARSRCATAATIRVFARYEDGGHRGRRRARRQRCGPAPALDARPARLRARARPRRRAPGAGGARGRDVLAQRGRRGAATRRR